MVAPLSPRDRDSFGGKTTRVVDKGAYFQRIGYNPFPKQKLFHNSSARFRVPVCGRRFGKDLYIGTPCLTPNGWQTMGSLSVDDYVYGPNGEPTKVVAKSEVFHHATFEVSFDDGSTIMSGADHQWAVETYTMRKNRGNGRWNVKPYKVLTTIELLKRVGSVKYPDSIMLSQPVQMPATKPAVDPYVWGVWLGDGTTGQAQLTAHTDDAPTYAREFEAVGYGLRIIPSKKYGWKIEGLTRSNCLVKVAGDEYRLGSIKQRLALLQGLMDTDGTLSNEQIQFDNKNLDLVELVAWLVNSLGGKGRFYQNQHNGETYHRFSFNIALPVFRLQRKLDKQMRLKQGSQTVRRYIKSVKQVESVPTQCIQVEGQDGLFLAGVELVVTHNSTMAGRDREPDLLIPDRRGWIIGPTYDLAEKEFRVIWDDMIIGLGLGRDKRVKRAYNKRSGEMYLEFPWKTRIECRSADHPENLVGERLDFAIMSEAAKHKKDTWERYIRAALADRRGGADFPTTPEGYNWLYDQWALGQNPDQPDYESWQFPSWANPVVYPGGRQDPEVLLIENTTILPWFLQEIGAEFSAFVGKIYEDFKETTHVRKHVFNPAWPNYIAFDWGYTNPLAAVEFQIDPWDTIYIWREHYRPYLTLGQHMEILKNRDQPEGYHLDLAFGDAADPGAAIEVSQSLVACYALPEAKSGVQKGGKTESGWREGVELVNTFLKLRQTGVIDEYGTPKEEPKLFVDHSCVNTIREFNNYRAPSSVGRVLRNPREDAQKYDDHTLDAIRYALMHIYKLGARHKLSDVYTASDLSTGDTFTVGSSGNSYSDDNTSGYFTMANMEHF